MKKRLTITFCIVSLNFFVFMPLAQAQDKDAWIPVAMHIATTVSDGTLSVDEILKAAREEGVKSVILTDRDFMKWEYGFWPLQKILHKTIEANSIFKYGISKYLHLIELKSRENPDIFLSAGLESAPYYYWKGSPFSKDFSICGWHKHLLVILPDSRDYSGLPVFLNHQASNYSDSRFDVLLLWPFLGLLLGLWVLRRPICSYKDDRGCEIGRPSKRCRMIGVGILLASIVFIINNYPFRRPSIDPYCPDAGDAPYQKLIDYAVAKNGLIFWAHPEASYMSRRGRVLIETPEATPDLWRTQGYTGFSIFHEGYEHVGKIGGAWDGLLKQYCDEKRRSPVWATAGIAFDFGTLADLKKAMRELRLDVLAASVTKQGVLDAMKQGRMVVSRGSGAKYFHLATFVIIDDASGREATLGEDLVFSGKPVVCVKGGGREATQAKITLIRDGAVIKEEVVPSPFDYAFVDHHPLGKKTYYRLEIRQGDVLLVTNPIFVRPK